MSRGWRAHPFFFLFSFSFATQPGFGMVTTFLNPLKSDCFPNTFEEYFSTAQISVLQYRLSGTPLIFTFPAQ